MLRAVLPSIATLLLASTAAARPPNILLLITDDQRPDTIHALGNPHIQTPNLDDLVRRGTVCTRATCAHPLCYPSRAELLTGCTGFRSGTYSEQKLNEGVPLLPMTLKQAGYRTFYVGKWHTAGRPSTIGFDECDRLYAGGGGRANEAAYVDFRGRPATGYRGWVFQTDAGQRFSEKGVGLTPNISAEFADAAIRLIGKRGSAQPFFVHVNFTAPHDPRIWPTDRRVDAAVNRAVHGPASYRELYESAKLPLPANFRGEHPFDHGNARGRDEVLLPFPRTEDDVRQELACYYAVISHLDAQVGRILKALDESGQRDNTIVVFTADHGLAIGSHGLVGKQNMYEHTINVPLIVAGPGIPAGQKRSAQCYLRDLFPTFCELAGVGPEKVAGTLRVPSSAKTPSSANDGTRSVPATLAMDGRSLVPVLRGEKSEIHPFIVGYFQDSQRMIREGNWKLCWYPKIDRWQLFDVASDPHELRDRVSDAAQQDRVYNLRKKLTDWLSEHRDPLLAPPPAPAGNLRRRDVDPQDSGTRFGPG
jgi:arylsulfatase A-like enzyme